jgi:hypothetical protein
MPTFNIEACSLGLKDKGGAARGPGKIRISELFLLANNNFSYFCHPIEDR